MCCLALGSLSIILIIGAVVSLGISIYLLYKAINIVLTRVTVSIINLVTVSVLLSISNTLGFSLLS